MTVEASLLMPIVLAIMVGLIYLGFYCYDVCLTKQDDYRMLIRVQQRKWSEDDEIEDYFSKEENDWYYDKYVLYSHQPRQLSLSTGSIGISQSGRVEAPNLTLLSDENSRWVIEDTVEGSRFDVVRILRDLRKAEGK